jgi:hypothetical protein
VSEQNRIVRYTSCGHCEAQIPVWEFGIPGTWGDQGYIRILKHGHSTNIGLCCWNKLVNTFIQFGPRGWEWVEPVLVGRSA